MQHCCMFVSFHFFRFILSLLFRLLLIHAQYTHTRARACTHCSIAFLFFPTVACVCVACYIFFLSLFRNWPSDLLLSLFLPTLVYNAVLSSSSSVCHCDLFLLYSFSLSYTHVPFLAFIRSISLSRFLSHSIQASVFSPSLAAHY